MLITAVVVAAAICPFTLFEVTVDGPKWAEAEEIQTVSGIGPVKAAHLIEAFEALTVTGDATASSPRRIDQPIWDVVDAVSGIGPVTLEALKSLSVACSDTAECQLMDSEYYEGCE